MLIEIFRTLRDLGRLEEIAAILIRYGFGELVDRLGMRRVLVRAGRKFHLRFDGAYADIGLPERVRRAAEEMGPTFIKFGQIVGTRVDLLPPEWIEELSKRQRHVPPMDFDRLQVLLEKDLGAPIATVFAQFDVQPIAAASMAQVHAARLRNGADVLVKIRRPDIQRTVEADIRLMGKFANLLEFEFPELAVFQPGEIVRQFASSIRNELNFVNESSLWGWSPLPSSSGLPSP
jgi:ubiquinone biosynthesis protein